jgi:hypothetical protein
MHANADMRETRTYDRVEMKKAMTILALLIAACGDSDDPKPDGQITAHDELACDSPGWAPVQVGAKCERLCVTKPPGYEGSGGGCTATTPALPGTQMACPSVFTELGFLGCCIAESPGVTRFWECR